VFLALTLPLFVARVVANHVQTAVPPDQLAILTNTLHARTNFHDRFTFSPGRKKGK
jgi:hypothetical protein